MEQRFVKETVRITASDGTALAANYYDAPGDGVILLHQLNQDKSSWEEFARELQAKGFSSVAIDLRGHGESQGSWQAFHDSDFEAMLKDAEAASTFLQQRKKRPAAILGASIGANTALRHSSQHRLPAVLLSPGLNYRGIDVNNVTSSAPVLVIVSQGDEYSRSSSEELDKNNLFGDHKLVVLEGKEHGTFLLADERARREILVFLESYLNT